MDRVSPTAPVTLRVVLVEDDVFQQVHLRAVAESIETSTPGLTLQITTCDTAQQVRIMSSIGADAWLPGGC